MHYYVTINKLFENGLKKDVYHSNYWDNVSYHPAKFIVTGLRTVLIIMEKHIQNGM